MAGFDSHGIETRRQLVSLQYLQSMSLPSGGDGQPLCHHPEVRGCNQGEQQARGPGQPRYKMSSFIDFQLYCSIP